MLPFIKCLFLPSLVLFGLGLRPTDDVETSQHISLVSDATAHLQAAGTALAQTSEFHDNRSQAGKSADFPFDLLLGSLELALVVANASDAGHHHHNYSYHNDSYYYNNQSTKKEKVYYLPKTLKDTNGALVPVLSPASVDGRWWAADNSRLGAGTPGLAYRNKQKVNAKSKKNYILHWGKTVQGRDLGDWVEVKKSKAQMPDGEMPYEQPLQPTQKQTRFEPAGPQEKVVYLPKTLTFDKKRGEVPVLFPATRDKKWWTADNSVLGAENTAGLGYRSKMKQNKKIKGLHLNWGRTVQGNDVLGYNWVEVTESKASNPNGETPVAQPSEHVKVGAGVADENADIDEMISPPPLIQVSGDASMGQDLRGVIDAYGVAWAVKLDKSFMRRMRDTSWMPFKNNSVARNGGGVENSSSDFNYVKANIYLDLKLLRFNPTDNFPAPIVWSKIDKNPQRLLETGFQTKVKLKGWWQDQLKHFRGKGMVRNRNKKEKNWVAWALIPWRMVDIQFDRDGARFYVEWIPGNGAWFSFRRNYNSKKKRSMTFRLDVKPDVEPKELRSIYKSGPLPFPVTPNDQEMLVMTMKPYEWIKDAKTSGSSSLYHYRASVHMGFLGLNHNGEAAKNKTWKQSIPGTGTPWWQYGFEQGVWRCSLQIDNKTIKQSGYLQYQAMGTTSSCLPDYSNRTDTSCPWLHSIHPEYDLKLLDRQIVMRQTSPLTMTRARISSRLSYSLYPIYADDLMLNWRQKDNLNSVLWNNLGGMSVAELLGDAVNNTDENGTVQGQPVGNSTKADAAQALQRLKEDLRKANKSINYFQIKNEELQYYNDGLEADIESRKQDLAAKYHRDYGPGSPYKIALDRKQAAEKELSELRKQKAQWMGLCPGWEMNMTNGRPYYFNQETGKSSWTKPDCGHGSSHLHPYVATSVSSSRQSVQNSLCPGWQVNLTYGKEFYFNVGTGQSSWTRPTCNTSSPAMASFTPAGQNYPVHPGVVQNNIALHPAAAPIAGFTPPQSNYSVHPAVVQNNTASQPVVAENASLAVRTAAAAAVPDCPGWQSTMDEKGRFYYFNPITKANTWEKPACARDVDPDSDELVLCPGWKWEMSNGKPYYWKITTKETTWTKPVCTPPP